MMYVKIIATGSKGNCYIIGDGATAVMIDPGLPYKKILESTNFGVSNLKGCLITHEHIDHTRGVYGVSEIIKVYATQKTLDELNRKKPLVLSKAIEKRRILTIGTLSILPFPVVHSAVDPVGYKIDSLWTLESLVFITDSRYSPYKMRAKFLVAECNYDDEILSDNVANGTIEKPLARRIRRDHMSLATVIEMLKQAEGVEILYIIHTSRSNLDKEKALEEIRQVYKGKIITHDKEVSDEDNNNIG